jgi:hypothetical protein
MYDDFKCQNEHIHDFLLLLLVLLFLPPHNIFKGVIVISNTKKTQNLNNTVCPINDSTIIYDKSD